MVQSRETEFPLHNGFPTNEGLSIELASIKKEAGRPHGNIPHRQTHYGIAIFECGAGEHYIDFEPYPIKPNALFCFSPGQIHFLNLTKPYSVKIIRFSEKFILSSSMEQKEFFELDFFNNLFGTSSTILDENQGNFIIEMHGKMVKEYNEGSYGWMAMLRAYLRIILIYLQRIFDNKMDRKVIKKRTSIVYQFNKHVSKYYLAQRGIAFYASKIGVSVSYLNNSVKLLTGVSPGQIIRNEIVLEAKRLLAYSNSNIAEIGYYLKFDDPSYFGRFFKRETNMSPREFRTQLHEKYHFYVK